MFQENDSLVGDMLSSSDAESGIHQLICQLIDLQNVFLDHLLKFLGIKTKSQHCQTKRMQQPRQYNPMTILYWS